MRRADNDSMEMLGRIEAGEKKSIRRKYEDAKSTADQPNDINTSAHVVEKIKRQLHQWMTGSPQEGAWEVLLLVDDFALTERLSALIFLDVSSCSQY